MCRAQSPLGCGCMALFVSLAMLAVTDSSCSCWLVVARRPPYSNGKEVTEDPIYPSKLNLIWDLKK